MLYSLVLMLLLPLTESRGVAPKRPVQNGWKTVRVDCERYACRHMAPIEDENCLLRCQAPPCYDAIYAANPLEPGELDVSRGTYFTRCLRELETVLRAAKMWPPRLSTVDVARVVQVEGSGSEGGADAPSKQLQLPEEGADVAALQRAIDWPGARARGGRQGEETAGTETGKRGGMSREEEEAMLLGS